MGYIISVATMFSSGPLLPLVGPYGDHETKVLVGTTCDHSLHVGTVSHLCVHYDICLLVSCILQQGRLID
jgi:hypothetical protein